MKKFFLALLKAACYALLFLMMQVVVVTAATMVFAIQQGVEIAMSGGTFDVMEITELAASSLLQNTGLLTVISSAFSLFLLWPVFAAGKKKYFKEVSLLPARPAASLTGAIFLGLSFAFVLGIVLDLLPIPESVWEEYAEYSAGISDQSRPLLSFLATVIVAPITEEIFFRGLIYTRLKRGMPTIVAILVESAIFGAMHGAAIWMAYAFVLGIVMTLLYEKFGSILVSIAFHAAFNLAGGYLVPMMDSENGIVYWAALAIGAAISLGAAAWLISMPKYRLEPVLAGGMEEHTQEAETREDQNGGAAE